MGEERRNDGIDLHKIFTPATDYNNRATRRNRTLFASSSFYSTSMHPTVEDQIAMARTISNSLSDVSNKRSRGQLMYVNRRIRSAMWVHESPNGPNDESTAETNENEITESIEVEESNIKENGGNTVLDGSNLADDSAATNGYKDSVLTKEWDERQETRGGWKQWKQSGVIPTTPKPPQEEQQKPEPVTSFQLRKVMNPFGQVRDFNSAKDTVNTETGLLSPTNCAEVVSALQLHKGKGAELFEKRRRVADKWIVDGTSNNSNITNALSTSNNDSVVKKESTEEADNCNNFYKNLSLFRKYDQQDNIGNRQQYPLKDNAVPPFSIKEYPAPQLMPCSSVNVSQLSSTFGTTESKPIPPPIPPKNRLYFLTKKLNGATDNQPLSDTSNMAQPKRVIELGKSTANGTEGPHRSEFFLSRLKAYEPSIPQGWNKPKITLPKEMYLPKEIPLQNYKRPSTMANDPNEIGDTTLATFNSVSKFKHLGSCQTISAIPMSEKPRQNVLFNVKKFVSYNVEQQQQSQLGQSEETTYPIWQKLNTENTKATGIDSNENKINCREGNGLLAENPLPYTDF